MKGGWRARGRASLRDDGVPYAWKGFEEARTIYPD
jgi:hypothetical protein